MLPTRKKVNIFFFFAFDEDTGITTPYHIDEQDISPEEFEFLIILYEKCGVYMKMNGTFLFKM